MGITNVSGRSLARPVASTTQTTRAPTAAASTPAAASGKAALVVKDSFEGQSVSLPKTKSKALSAPGFNPTEGAPGAYYRKVESGASRENTGVSATVTLPRFQLDPNPSRTYVSGDIAKMGPMDRPSVYLGSHATAKIDGKVVHAEADIGLQWSRRFDSNGRATFVPAAVQNGGGRPTQAQLYYQSKDGTFTNQKGEPYKGNAKDMVPHFCFTPFVRTDEPVLDAKGKPVLEAGGKVEKKNEYQPLPGITPKNQDRYFYAGDRVSMKVERTPGSDGNNVRFSVARDGGAALSVGFHSNVLGRQDAEVSAKRVTSIDQFTQNDKGERVGVESTKSKQVVPTRSTLTGMVWERADLLTRGGKSQSMTGAAFQRVYGRDPGNLVNEQATFRVSGFTSAGGEKIDIVPTRPR